MSRWSPQVLPEAPRLARPLDIGSALATVADGLDTRRDRRQQAARQQVEDDRYADRENQARIDRFKAEQRQAALDQLAAEDRQVQREDRYLTTRGRATDQGFVPEGERTARRNAAAGLQNDGRDPYGLMFDGIGDALLAATDDAPTTTLTRPDGSRESLVFDPTQTKSVRDEMRTRERDRWEQSLKPAPRDPVADDLRQHEGRLQLDRKYGAGDFRPRERSGGDSASNANLSIADKMFDNADRVVARVERMEPRAPDYAKWAGGDRPDPEFAPASQVAAYKADSTARAAAFDQQHGAWRAKLGDATRKAQAWMSIGDALAREAVGATGGDAVLTAQQINAQREIQELGAVFARDLAEIRRLGDKQGEQELQQQYTRDVQLINQKYGIRPRAED